MLAALQASKTPLSAYDLIDSLARSGEKIAPTQAYRVIGQLKDAGLVLRVESQNAFIAAEHVHAPDEPIALLLCESCGKVEEADATLIAPALTPAAMIPAALARGFKPSRTSLEVFGECGSCAAGTHTV